MADYIEREAAIGAIVELTCFKTAPEINAYVEEEYHRQREWIGGIRDALIEIGDIPAADAVEKLQESKQESKQVWIPVTERLPLRGDAVLCVGDNGIGVADFVCGDKWCALPWFYVDGERETNVTYWMPLPEPPDHIGDASEMVESPGDD